MVDLDTIVSLCKRRGFLFQSSEIYGGLGSAWDYGPLGVEFKNNVKRLWWRDVVHRRDDMVGLDAAITMHPRVWEASGHASNFADPFTSCLECKRNYRDDQLGDALKNSKWVKAVLKVLDYGTLHERAALLDAELPDVVTSRLERRRAEAQRAAASASNIPSR